MFVRRVNEISFAKIFSLGKMGEGNPRRKYNMMISKKMSFNQETTGICVKLTEQPVRMQRKQYFGVSDFFECKPGALESPLMIIS